MMDLRERLGPVSSPVVPADGPPGTASGRRCPVGAGHDGKEPDMTGEWPGMTEKSHAGRLGRVTGRLDRRLGKSFLELDVVAEADSDGGFLEVVTGNDFLLYEGDDFVFLQAQEGLFIHVQ